MSARAAGDGERRDDRAPDGDARDDRATDGEALELTVRDLLARRAPGATICPSEAARAVGGDDWRALMEPVRAAARRLAARGEVEITQGGRVVDGSTATGPVRIRRTSEG